jgi:predicted DNA-binding transcriptional regulator YafY
MRSDRLLLIVIILSQKGLVTGRELAEHFEVSLRTIYRYWIYVNILDTKRSITGVVGF